MESSPTTEFRMEPISEKPTTSFVYGEKTRPIIQENISSSEPLTLTFQETETVIREVVQELVGLFSQKFKETLIDPDLGDPRPNALIMVNGKEMNVLEGLETELHEKDEVTIIPVSHGG